MEMAAARAMNRLEISIHTGRQASHILGGMKTKLSLLGLGLMALLAGGCLVQSIHPLFVEKDYLPCDQVVGTWEQRESDGSLEGTWVFAEKERTYALTHTDKEKRQAIFEVSAGRLGGETLLDLILSDPLPGRELNELAQWHLMPVHTFLKVTGTKESLSLTPMDLEWLAKHLQENPKALAHTMRRNGNEDGFPLLTAGTEELQKFVTKHLTNTNAFKKAVSLTRAKQPK